MEVVEAGRTQTLSDKTAAVASPAIVSNSEPETKPETKPEADKDTSGLGTFLTAARDKRGVSLEEAIRETKIPDHYVRMMESNDYSMISDQLYVLPFLRRYAEFLKLDPEDIVMRFVREVQRADIVQPSRSIEPIEMDRRRPLPKPRNWSRPAIAAAVIAGLVAIWIASSRHHHRTADNRATSNSTDQSASAH